MEESYVPIVIALIHLKSGMFPMGTKGGFHGHVFSPSPPQGMSHLCPLSSQSRVAEA